MAASFRGQCRRMRLPAIAVMVIAAQLAGAASALHAPAKAGAEARLRGAGEGVEALMRTVGGNSPLLAASSVPFLESDMLSCADNETEREFAVQTIHAVGRSLVEDEEASAAGAFEFEVPPPGSINDAHPWIKEIAGRIDSWLQWSRFTWRSNMGQGKSLFYTSPLQNYDGTSKSYFVAWSPDARSFKIQDRASQWLLVVKLIDNFFLRWYVADAKCDLYLPKLKPVPQQMQVSCTKPKVKVSYCVEFQLRTPIISPGLPLCIPEDLFELLYNLGPQIGGIIENIINQFSPYLLPLLEEYLAAGGTQEQLFEAAGLIFQNPAVVGALGGGGGGGASAIVSLLGSDALYTLLDGVNVGQLVQGFGFKGLLSTLVESQDNPTLTALAPYLPEIISGYYECGGETEPFLDALNAATSNPLVAPFLGDPSAVSPELLASAIGPLWQSVVIETPAVWDFLTTAPLQCIVDQGYVQPVVVQLTQNNPQFATIGESFPKIIDDYYNSGCTSAQFLAFAPILLSSQTPGTSPQDQTNILFQSTGTTPDGQSVGFTTPFGPNQKSIFQCLQPNILLFTSFLGVQG